MLIALMHVMVLVQWVAFEALLGKKRAVENETQRFAEEALLMSIFEPEAVDGHTEALERKAQALFRELDS